MTAEAALVATRRSLHAVAEHVLAGAQYRTCGRIALRVVPGGFATRYDPDLRVEDGELVGAFGRVPVDGSSPTALCARTGIGPVDLGEVYSDGSGVAADALLTVDPEAAAQLAQAWQVGHEALLQCAPDQDPVLWPEHFDVGISVGEVNLGVSPGDGFLAVPYAYVGPWTVPTDDAFFDAPFGAARPVADLGGVAGVSAFFAEGLRRSGGQGRGKV